MSKHKRVLRDGQISRGPARWARAAGNAFENPNSKGGRLYLKRTSIAYRLSEEYPERIGPLSHMILNWEYDPQVGARRYVRTNNAKYYTCSLYCAAMTVQLDHSIADYAALEKFFMEDDAAPLAFASPTRKVRCYCCGTDIQPN